MYEPPRYGINWNRGESCVSEIALLPGQFHDQYVEVKDPMISKHSTRFKAPVNFLNQMALINQRHMTNKFIDAAKDLLKKQESKEVKGLKAKVTKLQAKVKDANGGNRSGGANGNRTLVHHITKKPQKKNMANA